MRTIRELREADGMSQRDLARRLGLHYMTVYYWETGERALSAEQLRQLAQVFDVSMDEIALPRVDYRREGE